MKTRNNVSLAALSLFTAWALLPVVAHADDNAALEIARVRAEFEQKLKELQQGYEARLQVLEARLAQRENAPAPVPPVSVPIPVSVSTNAFNPEISLTLQGAYVRQKDVAERRLSGFLTGAADQGGSERGFTLGHSELGFAANIDPHLRGQAIFAVADNAVEVEEAWFQTLGLGRGFTLKGGRFLSGIGYANEQHPHAWDFADASLMQRALFGEQLRQDGVQLKWLAPTSTWLEFGLEAARGQVFPGSAAGGNRNGAGLRAAFVRTGGDVGDAHSWRAGLGHLAARPRDREAHPEDVTGIEAHTDFSGKSATWLADFVWKWAPDGNPRERNFKFQTELFRRVERGELACADNSAAGGACVGSLINGLRDGLRDSWQTRQWGGYAQGVYQFMPGWRIGYRYDRLDAGSLAAGALPFVATGYRPQRHSAMTDWSPSEFSRFRLQLAHDKSMQGSVDNQATLQYIHNIGAHGAHTF